MPKPRPATQEKERRVGTSTGFVHVAPGASGLGQGWWASQCLPDDDSSLIISKWQLPGGGGRALSEDCLLAASSDLPWRGRQPEASVSPPMACICIAGPNGALTSQRRPEAGPGLRWWLLSGRQADCLVPIVPSSPCPRPLEAHVSGRTHTFCSLGPSPPQQFRKCSATTPALPLLGHGHGPKHARVCACMCVCVHMRVCMCLLTKALLTSSQHSGFSPILSQPGLPKETPESELVPG